MNRIILIHNGYDGIVPKLIDKLIIRIKDIMPDFEVDISKISYIDESVFKEECDEMLFLHPAERELPNEIPERCLIIPMLQKGHLPDSKLRINSFEYDNQNFDESTIERLCNIILNKIGIIKYSRKVFISYKRSESKKLADIVRKVLAIEGYSVFLDTKEIDVGVDFMQEIRRSIAECDVFLMIDSPTYYNSIYTKKELYAACISGVAIIVLSDACHLSHSLNGLNRVIIENHGEFTDKDKVNLLKAIQDSCIGVWKSRHQRLNRHINLFQEQEVFIQGIYIPSKSTSIYAITGLPSTMDFQRIHQHHSRFKNIDMQEANKSNVYALYDDLVLPVSYSKHLKWLKNEMPNINMIRTSSFETDIMNLMPNTEKIKNEKPIVFLSASLPNEGDTDYNFLRIHDTIVTLTETVIKSGGTLVFGGHPTITPVILNIMEIMAEDDNGEKQYPRIYLYQSKFFEKNFPPETKVFPKERLELVKEAVDQKQSLARMREEMINAYQYTSAFFIGGKYDKEKGVESSGVWDEYIKFSEKHPKAVGFYLEHTGVVPLKLYEYFGSARFKRITVEDIPIKLLNSI